MKNQTQTTPYLKKKQALVSFIAGLSLFAGGVLQTTAQTVHMNQATSVVNQVIGATNGSVTASGSTDATDLAIADINTNIGQAIIPAPSAVAGDLIDRTVTNSPVVSADNGTVAEASTDITIVNQSIALDTDVVGKAAPVVTNWSSQKKYSLDGKQVTQIETVVKTQTVEVVKEDDVVIKGAANTVDIVFVIDHSFSMDPSIAGVRQNIAALVTQLANKKINVRLGLAHYEDAANTHYIDFGGSHFTTDISAFITALNNIRIYGIFEEATIPLSYIASSGVYDWSTGPNDKRFAILITDEDIDYISSSAPSLSDTVQQLQAAKISTSVISEQWLEPVFNPIYTATSGKFIDIRTDYKQILETEIANWVVDEVQKGRLIKTVTDHYDVKVEIVYPKEDPKPTTTTTVTTTHSSETTEPTTTHSSETTEPTITSNSTITSVASKKILPKTGEEKQLPLVFTGLVLVTIVGFIYYRQRRQ